MMHTHTQIFFNERTARRTEFACVAWINLHARSTSIRSFIVRELYKLIPRCITNGLSEAMIPDHTLDIQILKGNDSEHRDESMTKLVGKVAAAVSDALMDAPCRFALLFSLCLRKFLLVRAKESWVSYLLARRKRGEVRKPNIYPNRLAVLRQRLCLYLDREARIPL